MPQMIHLVKKYSVYFILGIALIILFLLLPEKEKDMHIASMEELESPEELETQSVVPEEIVVDVKGAVQSPGIYITDSNARIHDVIEMAGGLTEDADANQVNFAQRVQDEMVIFVPTKDAAVEIAAGNSFTQADGKIKINYATKEEIETLPGIGPAKAEAIIQYREENGFFQSPEDLLNVSGIGEKTLEKLKDEIQVP